MLVQNPTSFTNPFASLEKSGDFSRINLVVPKEFVDLLMRTRPRPPGVVATTCNILLIKLLNELHRLGINDHTREQDFVSFVLNSRLVLGPIPDSPTPGSVPTSEASPDSRGTPGGHTTTPGTSLQSSEVQSSSQSNGRRKRNHKSFSEGESVGGV